MGFGGSGGGGGAIASSSDVALNNVTDTQVLAYDEAIAKWKNASASTGGAVSSVAGKTGAVTLDKNDVGLGSVDNTADTAKPVSTATQTALDAKAPLASPALTGTPTAPTATQGTATTQIATTAFVATTISNKVTNSGGAAGLWKGTQAAYDALGTYDAATVYIIVG